MTNRKRKDIKCTTKNNKIAGLQYCHYAIYKYIQTLNSLKHNNKIYVINVCIYLCYLINI